ncbi:MAG: hypothetical protein COU07_01640 [Candidatus Harrisonbacteria bacterium CG10_big_fil_rev_8_21_14_0_10_40_38]|uniref:Uncharacterized protein n=1 Tax=Candidatus Harrisonbacteria bacterium CG10_big_fil_rev_8_21_14_0_10_40_38 TaxID=1974583 RepID=A0A2H0UT22_9BACT|nr:MAG: hypothetical protein COU07_01640 [Candidatus Harrisonbacteria bacterium CG10_big_fil_rev_8_21_14_0_10_40_38]
MAIVFEQEKKQINWIKLLFVLFIVGFVIFAAYFLFFAPSPQLDVVLPEPLEQAERIGSVSSIKPNDVLGLPAFRALQVFVGPPSIGTLGRDNPFQPL